MSKPLIIAGIIQLLIIYLQFCQSHVAKNQPVKMQFDSLRIMFWNVENLFDPFDDSLTLDEEFTLQGIYGWTWSRFNRKLNNIYKVIMSAGWNPPDIIGLAEVENRWVLERLIHETPLSKFEYRIIHKDSPDVRGIDVTLLYLPDSFKPIDKSFIHVSGFKSGDDPTRDILYVKGIVNYVDTVSLIVNHWPSRYPGQTETIHKRRTAALTLKRLTDSLLTADPLCRIIIMGDFNDEPQDASISESLAAVMPVAEDRFPAGRLGKQYPGTDNISISWYYENSSSGNTIQADALFCLTPPLTNKLPGTIKFQGKWYLFDQFIVSGGLLAKSISYKSNILSNDFLFEPDKAYTGRKPYRTYNGYLYKGGYSDHLPILLELRFFRNENKFTRP